MRLETRCFFPWNWRAWATLVAAVGLLGLTGCQEPATMATPPPPTVGVVEARQMTVPVMTTPTGTTRSLRDVAVRARVRGFLVEQHFEEGSVVKKDQLLFVIEEEPFQVALKSAEARRDEAKATLRKAEASKEREVAEAQIMIDQAQLTLAHLAEARQRVLINRGAASQQDADQAIAERRAIEAQIEADRAKAAQAKIDYEVNILAAQARLDDAESAVRNAELDLSYCRMYSPIDGRIGEANVKLGNLVGPTSPGGPDSTELATIQQLDPMGVDVRVSSRYLEQFSALIGQGLEARLTRPGLEGMREHPYVGEVDFYDNAIDPTTSTFLVRARFPNPNHSLLPGDYVKLQMTIGTLEGAIVVPEQSVSETQSGPVVYTIDDEGLVAVQRIAAAQTYEGLRVVAEGLEPGRQVIVEGLQLVRPGIPVQIEEARLPIPVRSEPGDLMEEPKGEAASTDLNEEEEASLSKLRPGGPRSAVEASKSELSRDPEAEMDSAPNP